MTTTTKGLDVKTLVDMVEADIKVADAALDEAYGDAVGLKLGSNEYLPKPDRDRLETLLNGMQDTIYFVKAKLGLSL